MQLLFIRGLFQAPLYDGDGHVKRPLHSLNRELGAKHKQTVGYGGTGKITQQMQRWVCRILATANIAVLLLFVQNRLGA